MTTQALRSSFDDAAVAQADNEVLREWLQRERVAPPTTGVHPFVIQISLSGVIWFLAVAWLDFSGGPGVDFGPGGGARIFRHVLHAVPAHRLHATIRAGGCLRQASPIFSKTKYQSTLVLCSAAMC
jgi:hypothetical protein